jgi:GT2 family glycosyltransferase
MPVDRLEDRQPEAYGACASADESLRAEVASRLGVVAIGRNEGERLRRCLESVVGLAQGVVYVDSGSTDGSIAMARAMGIAVVELDMAIPFTAARARNAGFKQLEEVDPAVEFVQFVDGDCELFPDWLEHAAHAFHEDEHLGVAFGRLCERHPEASLYNRLCHLEWDTPIGEAKACGGNAMMRAAAFRQAGGFDPSLIAGEEPELCLRLRREGWRIVRLDADMALHDAAMTRFGQWWKRSVRAGFAYAEGYARHGRAAEQYRARETRSNWFWGLIAPAVALSLAPFTRGVSLALLAAVYFILFVRIILSQRRRGFSLGDAALYALFCVLGKFPQALGQLKCGLGSLMGRSGRLIEYKS